MRKGPTLFFFANKIFAKIFCRRTKEWLEIIFFIYWPLTLHTILLLRRDIELKMNFSALRKSLAPLWIAKYFNIPHSSKSLCMYTEKLFIHDIIYTDTSPYYVQTFFNEGTSEKRNKKSTRITSIFVLRCTVKW